MMFQADILWGGVPARKLETIEEYENKIKGKTFPTKYMDAEQKKKYIIEKL